MSKALQEIVYLAAHFQKHRFRLIHRNHLIAVKSLRSLKQPFDERHGVKRCEIFQMFARPHEEHG